MPNEEKNNIPILSALYINFYLVLGLVWSSGRRKSTRGRFGVVALEKNGTEVSLDSLP